MSNSALDRLTSLLQQASSSGNVVDVSQLQADGSGARVVAPPAPGSGMNQIAGFPVASNNYAGYYNAMNLLQASGEYDYMSLAGKYAQQFGTNGPSRAASPPRAASPRVAAPQIVPTAAPAKQAARSPKLSPAQRLNAAVAKAAAEGKVVDVSNLTAEGTGARTLKSMPGARSRKKSVPRYTYVISDNYPAYQLAMSFLGPQYASLAQEFQQMYGSGQVMTATQKKKAATGPSKAYGDVPVMITGPAVNTVLASTITEIPIDQVATRVKGAQTPRTPRGRRTARGKKSPRTPKAPKSPGMIPLAGPPPTIPQLSPGPSSRSPSPSRRSPSPSRLPQVTLPQVTLPRVNGPSSRSPSPSRSSSSSMSMPGRIPSPRSSLPSPRPSSSSSSFVSMPSGVMPSSLPSIPMTGSRSPSPLRQPPSNIPLPIL